MKLRASLFFFLRLVSHNSTLVNKTWKNIENEYPLLQPIRKEYRKYRLFYRLSSPISIIIIVLIIVSFFFALCFIPPRIIDTHFSWLALIKFPGNSAYSMISEMLSVTATIIGLSFVVTGFLFDTLRNQTQSTFEDMFRATSLYWTFAITIVGVITMIIINGLKYTVPTNTAGNFAVFSLYLLLATGISIGFLFFNVLKFFNPERISALSRRNLIRAAKFELLQERFIEKSSIIFIETMRSYDLTPEQGFFINNGDQILMTLNNRDQAILLDVFFPIIKCCAKDFHHEGLRVEFYPLKCNHYLDINQRILTFEANTTIRRRDSLLLSRAFLWKPADQITNEFTKEKDKLEKKVTTAAQTGDIETLKQVLSNINDLYEIYYKGSQ